MKKKVYLTECSDLDVLAEDIVNEKGVVLLPKGATINEYLIKKLQEFGIEDIYIFQGGKDEYLTQFMNYKVFEEKYENTLEETKRLLLEIIKGNKIDYSEVKKLSDSIIIAREEPEVIIKYMGKVRRTDDYTYSHCINVSFYSMLLAGWLNLSREDINIVVQAALLHDIGKIKVPNELLNKKEKLSVEEFEEIKRHVIYGYELIKGYSEIPDEIKDVILMHHEKENKSGYPLRAGGDDLSIYTKIVSVVDVYDALTSDRSYKSAITPFDAFEELLNCSKGTMDLHIVNTLLYNLSRYYTGSKVMLSNGQSGNVAYIPPHCISKPVVDVGLDFLDLYRERDISIVSMI